MDFLNNDQNHQDPFGEPVHSLLNNKLMLLSMLALSIVSVILLALYLYTIHLLRASPPRHRANTINRLSLTRLQDHTLPQTTGLDPALVASLPVFIVKPKVGEARGDGVMECVVCLGGFEDEKKAKLLPNCKHYFHVDCIDMWLASHSTCPLCRAMVQPRLEPQIREGPRTLALDGAPLVVVLPVSEPNSEGTSNGGVGEEHTIDGSNSRLSSFKNVLRRERSSRRIHHDDVNEDPER